MGTFSVWPATVAGQARLAAQAAAVLRSGSLVIFPTDTVYGLGADPTNAAAIRQLYEVKGRPNEKAIVWLVESAEVVRQICHIDADGERLARRFWPGPLTLVLRRLSAAGSELPTLGVRVPAHGAALSIILAAGGAVATTSANRSGEPSAKTALGAASLIGRFVDLIIDGGPTPVGLESTVVDLSTGSPRVVRPGAITQSQLSLALGWSEAPAQPIDGGR